MQMREIVVQSAFENHFAETIYACLFVCFLIFLPVKIEVRLQAK